MPSRLHELERLRLDDANGRNVYTLAEKRALYHAGRYSFPPPPVPSAAWQEDDWIRYVDGCGQWWKPRRDYQEGFDQTGGVQ